MNSELGGSRTGGLGGSAGRAVQALEKQLLDIPNLPNDTKESLAQGVQDIKDRLAFQGDVVFYRIVVGILGLVIILITIAITIFVLKDKKGFDALTAIGSAAIGGLVGLLAPSPGSSK